MAHLTESRGNMYDWVTHTHTHLGGECSNRCSYCYVGRSRFGRPEKYTGRLRLIPNSVLVDYGKGRTIFIEHMNDMFAQDVPDEWIKIILRHCSAYPNNEYVFQTKNPARAGLYISKFPPKFMIGTTIETNKGTANISDAPPTYQRALAIKALSLQGIPVFVTIEPILDFDPVILASWIIEIKPKFVNIGADSKGCGLEEPSSEKIRAFIGLLIEAGVSIKKKNNLGRLLEV